MKYLKGFNENKNIEDVESFCKMYLADLIDKGARVNISDLDTIIDGFNSKLYIFLGVGDKMPLWRDIKDSFIPFLEMFIREYGDVDIISLMGHTSISFYNYKPSELLSGDNDMKDGNLVRGIKFNFKR